MNTWYGSRGYYKDMSGGGTSSTFRDWGDQQFTFSFSRCLSACTRRGHRYVDLTIAVWRSEKLHLITLVINICRSSTA